MKAQSILMFLLAACGAAPQSPVNSEALTAQSANVVDELGPQPGLESLQPFIGRWACVGKMFDVPPFIVAHDVTGKLDVDWTLQGFWMEAQYAEKRTTSNPNPYAFRENWGLDKANQTFARFFIDNAGGRGDYSPTGVDGATVSWGGNYRVASYTLPVKDSVTMAQDQSSFFFKGQIDAGAGFIDHYELTCKRR